MNHTKDEITINITKKAKIWLSVILCAILVLTATIILIHRHNYLLSRQTPPTEQDGGGSEPETPGGPYVDDVDLSTSYLTQILQILDDVSGTYHSWFGIYFDNARVVDKVKANLTPSRYTQLESHAEYTMQIVERDYYSQLKEVTAETIFDSEDFQNATTTLKNLLNEAV